jgi:sorting and assembly machinery component 37
MFYSLNANWYGLTLPTLAKMLPIPQRYYVPARIRESYRPRLEAVQLWNLPGIEQEEKPHFWEREKLKEPTEGDRKEKFKRVFEREKVCCESHFIVLGHLTRI